MKDENLLNLFISIFGEDVDAISIGSATEVQHNLFLTILHCVDKDWAPQKTFPGEEDSSEQSRVIEKKIVEPEGRRLRSVIVVSAPNRPSYIILKERGFFLAFEVTEIKRLYQASYQSRDVPVLLFISAPPDFKKLPKILFQSPTEGLVRVAHDLSILFTVLDFKEEENAFDLVTIEWKIKCALTYYHRNSVSMFDVKNYPGMSGGLLRNSKGAWIGVISAVSLKKLPRSLLFPSDSISPDFISRVESELRNADYKFSIFQNKEIKFNPCHVTFLNQVSEQNLRNCIKEYIIHKMITAAGYSKNDGVECLF